jgi:hypothetical protein
MSDKAAIEINPPVNVREFDCPLYRRNSEIANKSAP